MEKFDDLPLTFADGSGIEDQNEDMARSRKKVVSDRKAKYFVKAASAPTAGSGSMLAGAEEDLKAGSTPKPRSRRLSQTLASREGFGDLVEVTHPSRPASDIILSRDSAYTLLGVANEFRRGDEIRRHGLNVRSKMLFCGPPGCGKSMCAEVVASELHMPLVVARLDAIIASHLGQTASNLRKLFEAAKSRSMVLFLDEFDAIARARSDATEHSEIRRVVNSLLMMIDRFEGRSLLIAATNLEEHVDRAIWRRFDEVVVFEKPSKAQIRRLLKIKTRNFRADFDISRFAERFEGMSYAQVERTCLSAIRTSILARESSISEQAFVAALEHESRRSRIENTILD
ncbi:AAA family ATPase [Qipengyuania seohaensis]|uniref:AAA family ATPase n=1 Tax=Qipengyuania seohaensis TaxID=266951 RepID=UPI0018E22741|nr:ATP-binding protein [Qipengyuania seohaensis]